MALLLVTDPIQNLLTFGAGLGANKFLKKAVQGSKWFRWGARFGDFALSSAFEGIEELSQDVIDANALGNEIDRENTYTLLIFYL